MTLTTSPKRSFNFSAGPSMLPTAVLERVQSECLDWSAGMSVMEVSHRSEVFEQLTIRTVDKVRRLLTVPDNYKILFIPGGATAQFAMIPMNFCVDLRNVRPKVDYFCTGIWSEKAIQEARKFADVNVVASSEASKYTTIPDKKTWKLDPTAAYCHYTPNETINGVAFQEIPETGDVPLVADMSSVLFSAPIDVSRFGLIYAGAQKNLGPAGLTLVIIRDDLLGRASPYCPALYDYQAFAKYGSMPNTPPTFVWYVIDLVLDWLLAEGGVDEMARRNAKKAEYLYQFIDDSNFYCNPVDKAFRSIMNIPFVLDKPKFDAKFLQEAEARGLMNLAGHRLVGGMRASLYNAMPQAGVEALCVFMQEFVEQPMTHRELCQ